MKQSAAIYCRSSKDKADIGLPTQTKELKRFADANGLHVVATFSDMELSGSLDEVGRAGFRDLLSAIQKPGREWNVLLAVDTSRIARDLGLAIAFKKTCEKNGVEIRYSKIDMDGKTAAGEMFFNMDRTVAQYLSRISAEKGRAGQEMNVSMNFRAGGPAPIGYKLQRHETGAVRGGSAVLKSKLVRDPRPAKKVQQYLRLRAVGTPRSTAAKTARLDKCTASLLAIERNALTFAGYTVWNVRKRHKPSKDDPRNTMEWRPRNEWIKSPKPTHEPLITSAEAERILAAVEKGNPKTRPMALRKPDQYLLTGLLYTPDGTPWQGDGKFYRVGRRGKRIPCAEIDQWVSAQVAREIRGKEFLAKAVLAAHELANNIVDDPAVIDQALRSVDTKIRNLVDVVAETGQRALVTKLNDLEAERTRLRTERTETADRARMKRDMRRLTTRDMQAMLEFSAAPIEAAPGADVPELRRALAAVVRRVEFDRFTRSGKCHFRLLGAGVTTP